MKKSMILILVVASMPVVAMKPEAEQEPLIIQGGLGVHGIHSTAPEYVFREPQTLRQITVSSYVQQKRNAGKTDEEIIDSAPNSAVRTAITDYIKVTTPLEYVFRDPQTLQQTTVRAYVQQQRDAGKTDEEIMNATVPNSAIRSAIRNYINETYWRNVLEKVK